MLRTSLLRAAVVVTALAAAAHAQENAPDSIRKIDACGTVVRGETCFLVEVSGGRFVVEDFAGFGLGDSVRVIGTLDENCITFCSDADGCIRGAELFDPSVFPCGTPIGVPFDPCSGLSTGLLALSLVALAAHSSMRRLGP